MGRTRCKVVYIESRQSFRSAGTVLLSVNTSKSLKQGTLIDQLWVDCSSPPTIEGEKPMNLKHRISKHLFGRIRNKRKKRIWNYIWLVISIAACDVLILYVLFWIFLPLLLDSTPFLLPEDIQEYSHLSTHFDSFSAVSTLAFSPDDKVLAKGLYEKIVMLNIETGMQQEILIEANKTVISLAFSPDGRTLASSNTSNDKSVILYDTTTNQVKSHLSGHPSWITYLDYSPDGKTLVGASENGMITAWDTNTGVSFQPTLGTVAYANPSTKLGTVPYANLSIHGYYYSGNIIVRWNWIINENHIGNTPDYLKSVLESDAFHDTGIIAMAPGPNTLPIYLSSHAYPIGGLAFSPDGMTLASCSRSGYQPFNITMGKIHLWNIETAMPISTLRTPGWKVERLAFSLDGKYLASDGSKRLADSRKILVWDLTTRQLITMIDTNSVCEITALEFASDNRTLASGDKYGRVSLWYIGSN